MFQHPIWFCVDFWLDWSHDTRAIKCLQFFKDRCTCFNMSAPVWHQEVLRFPFSKICLRWKYVFLFTLIWNTLMKCIWMQEMKLLSRQEDCYARFSKSQRERQREREYQMKRKKHTSAPFPPKSKTQFFVRFDWLNLIIYSKCWFVVVYPKKKLFTAPKIETNSDTTYALRAYFRCG